MASSIFDRNIKKFVINNKKIIDNMVDNIYVYEDVKNMIENNFEIYLMFLTINVVLYNYDVRYLDKKIVNRLNFYKLIMTLNDIEIYQQYYYYNMELVTNLINFIIDKKIVDNSEIIVLKEIILEKVEI